MQIMAIEISEFLADLKKMRKHIDPEEKIRQWQGLKQRSQFNPSEKTQSIPNFVSPTLIVLGPVQQKRKKSDGNEKKSE